MSKKTFGLIGMIVSLAIVLCGILTITGTFGGDTGYASGSYLYDSGYASFGADFYTYVSNNAAEAADGARTAANNLDDIAELLKNALGIFLIGFGAMGFCFFGMARCECTEVAAAAEPAAVEVVAAAAADAESVCEDSEAEESVKKDESN